MTFEWVTVGLLSIWAIVRFVWLASQSGTRHETTAMLKGGVLVSTVLVLAVIVRILLVFDVTAFDFLMALVLMAMRGGAGGAWDVSELREIDMRRETSIFVWNAVFTLPLLVSTIVLR